MNDTTKVSPGRARILAANAKRDLHRAADLNVPAAYAKAYQAHQDAMAHQTNFDAKYNIGNEYRYTPAWAYKVSKGIRAKTSLARISMLTAAKANLNHNLEGIDPEYNVRQASSLAFDVEMIRDYPNALEEYTADHNETFKGTKPAR